MFCSICIYRARPRHYVLYNVHGYGDNLDVYSVIF